MKLEETLVRALDLERKIQGVYAVAAREVADQRGRRVLNALAADEAEHVRFLQIRLADWKARGKLAGAPVPPTRLPPPEKILAAAKGLRAETGRPVGSGGGGKHAAELAVLRKALELEVAAGDFYRQAVAQLEDPASRELFQPFLKIEGGHQTLVQAEIDSLSGTGFWFDVPEFRME